MNLPIKAGYLLCISDLKLESYDVALELFKLRLVMSLLMKFNLFAS